jgi:outer membrane protein
MRILLLAIITFSASISVQAQTTPRQPTANGKIGYVDVENVIARLPEYKQMEVKLEEMKKRLSDELQTKRQSFENLYTDYMQNANAMADSSRVKAEGQLQQMDEEIKQFQRDAQNTFVNTKKLFLGPVYLRLGGVIREVAVENGFSMILPYRVGNSELLLHSDAKLDVSELVVKKFTATK